MIHTFTMGKLFTISICVSIITCDLQGHRKTEIQLMFRQDAGGNVTNLFHGTKHKQTTVYNEIHTYGEFRAWGGNWSLHPVGTGTPCRTTPLKKTGLNPEPSNCEATILTPAPL